MKKNFHPVGYKLTLVDTKGVSHEVQTYVKPVRSDVRLSLDMHNHVAWNKKGKESYAEDKLKKFNERYGHLNI